MISLIPRKIMTGALIAQAAMSHVLELFEKYWYPPIARNMYVSSAITKPQMAWKNIFGPPVIVVSTTNRPAGPSGSAEITPNMAARIGMGR